MIEEIFQLTLTEDQTVERIIVDDLIHYAHIVLPAGERVPPHPTNATVYMTVLRGVLSIRLGEQPNHDYSRGTIIKIPKDTMMEVQNTGDAVLELTVVKAGF